MPFFFLILCENKEIKDLMGAEIKVYSVALLNCLTPRCVRYILASDFRQEEKSLRSFTVAPLGTIYWLITSILCPLELFFSFGLQLLVQEAPASSLHYVIAHSVLRV